MKHRAPQTHAALLSVLALLAASACASSNPGTATTHAPAPAAPTPATRPVLGVLTGHGEASSTTELSYLSAYFQSEGIAIDVHDVTLMSGEVPGGLAGLLVVATPRTTMPTLALRALDMFLARGGNLAVFVSGVSTSAVDQPRAELTAAHHELGAWLASYGVQLGADLVLDERCLEGVVSANGQPARAQLFTWPSVPRVDPTVHQAGGTAAPPLDPASPLTRGVDALALPFASSLTLTPSGMESAGVTRTAFARSGPRSVLRTALGTVDLQELLGQRDTLFADPRHGPYVLGVAIEGLAGRGREGGKLVVVGSAQMLSLEAERVPAQVSATGNSHFLANLGRYLTSAR